MFGIPSIQKLLVLAVVIAIVWYGFKFVGRLQDRRDAAQGLGQRKARRPKARGRAAAAPEAPEAEDMVACPVCQAYVQARGASRCDRTDCPY